MLRDRGAGELLDAPLGEFHDWREVLSTPLLEWMPLIA